MVLRLILVFSRFLLFVFVSGLIFAQGNSVEYENGIVVSASRIASKVGIEILKRGGNAVDAAVATGFALSVVYPSAGNLGGGGFFIIYSNEGKSSSIDFREKAPLKSNTNMFLDSNLNPIDGLSVNTALASGVPGTVAGYIYALEKFGTMSLQEVISPAIELAENGFLLETKLAQSINSILNYNIVYDETINNFFKDKIPLKSESKLIQKDLAKTLLRIQQLGFDGFYRGETAELILNCMQKHNGIISKEDLESYSPIERNVLKGNFNGFEILTMPPPSSGGVAILQILNVLKKYDFSSSDWGSANYIHTLTEIFKHIYAYRAKYLGDNDFYKVPISELLSDSTAESIKSKIGYKALPSNEIISLNFKNTESKETTHFSVIDNFGNSVSATITLNSSFGNKLVVDGAGFLLNNEMDDFSIKPGYPNQFGLLGNEANAILPGKRMLSSMTPTIVLKNNKPFLILGSPGGSTIITSVFQVLYNVLNFEMNLADAVNFPRFHHQWKPDYIQFEEFSINSEVQKILREKGQKLKKIGSLGRVEAILIENNTLYGVSDKRGYGAAVGY